MCSQALCQMIDSSFGFAKSVSHFLFSTDNTGHFGRAKHYSLSPHKTGLYVTAEIEQYRYRVWIQGLFGFFKTQTFAGHVILCSSSMQISVQLISLCCFKSRSTHSTVLKDRKTHSLDQKQVVLSSADFTEYRMHMQYTSFHAFEYLTLYLHK